MTARSSTSSSSTRSAEAKPPSVRLLPGELLALARLWTWRGANRKLAAGRTGGGRPVLVLPGLLASDAYTLPLRRTLRLAGYRAHGWELGQNRGIHDGLIDAMLGRLNGIAAREGPAALVGWSLGGLYARELAKLRPELVERVITLGSPFSGDLRANRAWKLYERVAGHGVDRPPIDFQLHAKPPVRTFALWSRIDGIVAPACARGGVGEADHIVELRCAHMGLVSEPVAVRAILDALEA